MYFKLLLCKMKIHCSWKLYFKYQRTAGRISVITAFRAECGYFALDPRIKTLYRSARIPAGRIL
jgi:hypothetical protein